MQSLASSSSNSSGSEQSKMAQQLNCISKLPQGILLYILSFLSLQDSIKLSSASREWEHLWTHTPQLCIDELEITRILVSRYTYNPPRDRVSLAEHLEQINREVRNNFKDIVGKVLRLHSGCMLKKFHLSFQCDSPDEDLRTDSWIHFAFERNIEETKINFCLENPFRLFDAETWAWGETVDQMYELPGSQFSPRLLKTLSLSLCRFGASSFKVFSSLQRLSLMQVKLSGCSIGDIVSIAPVLEDVMLRYCVLPTDFLICNQDVKIKKLSATFCMMCIPQMVPISLSAPNLLTLTLVGRYKIISPIKKASDLLDVRIDIRQTASTFNHIIQPLEGSITGNILGSLLSNLSHCITLHLSSWCIQVLATWSNLPKRFPYAINNLKDLKLSVHLTNQELPGILFLLMSCPNIECLTMFLDREYLDWETYHSIISAALGTEEYNSLDIQQNSRYHCLEYSLKTILISGFIGGSNEIQMIEFLLRNAAVLEKMHVFKMSPGMCGAFSQQQLSTHTWFSDAQRTEASTFNRASPGAQVEFYEMGP